MGEEKVAAVPVASLFPRNVAEPAWIHLEDRPDLRFEEVRRRRDDPIDLLPGCVEHFLEQMLRFVGEDRGNGFAEVPADGGAVALVRDVGEAFERGAAERIDVALVVIPWHAGDGFDDTLCVESTLPLPASSTVIESPASDISGLTVLVTRTRSMPL